MSVYERMALGFDKSRICFEEYMYFECCSWTVKTLCAKTLCAKNHSDRRLTFLGIALLMPRL